MCYILMPNVMIFGGIWGVIKSRDGALMIGLDIHPLLPLRTQQEHGVREPGSKPSANIESTSDLTTDIQAPEL